MPGATVTLTNRDTGIEKKMTAGGGGEYTFSLVKIGNYAVSAESEGFRQVEHTNVTVQVQQRVVVDFSLPPGQTSQTVEVTGQPPPCKPKTPPWDR
jgi:hypothetical protein